MEKKSIIKSTLQVSVALLLIKVLGVLKQSLIAAICGATAETDVYFIATNVIVALCSVLFSSISITLLSLHTERLISSGRKSSNNLINAALRVFIPISLGIAIVFVLCAPGIAKFLAPSYYGEQLNTLSRYIRLMSVMFVFTCYYLIVNVILETDKRFLPGKGQSFFQNLFICIAAICFYPKFGIISLIFAFIFAGIVQCVQITWNARHEFKFLVYVKQENELIHKLLMLSVPLIIGNAIYEINDIVDKQIATGLGHGNVSFLSYGASINEIVTTLIISSVSTVLFSHYATWVAEGNVERIGDSLKKSLEYLVTLIMPVMIMCFVCGDYIVAILYGRGNFGHDAIISTASVVMGYAAGFLFQASRANIVRVYYAFQNTREPMVNGAISIAVNILLSILLSKVFGVAGIALATSIAMLLVSILLFPGLKKFIPGFSLKSSVPEYIKTAVSACIIGIFAWMLKRVLHFNVIVSFIIIGLFVVIAYVILCVIMNVSVARVFADRIWRKIQGAGN